MTSLAALAAWPRGGLQPPSPAPAVFVHDILFDPTPGFVATAILPTGTSPLVEFFFGALSPGLDLAPGAPEPRMFLIALPDSSLRISAALGGVFDDEAIDDLFPGTFSWSPSDPIILTATPTGFSVSDSDDSTGTITYATAFDDSGLTLDSFGGAADFAIGALTSGSSPSPVTVDLDFVSLDGVAVPEASESLVLLLGVSGLLSGRRRKNRR